MPRSQTLDPPLPAVSCLRRPDRKGPAEGYGRPQKGTGGFTRCLAHVQYNLAQDVHYDVSSECLIFLYMLSVTVGSVKAFTYILYEKIVKRR